ncbi:MAG: hypothetical protein IJX47_02000 [Clostridia bacterium]|nr:hypothetical protein [Clostridia bacterium]
MKYNTVKIMTMIMIVISSLITVAMAIFTVLAGVIVKAIPPVAVLLLTTVFWVWTDIHYLNCYEWLKDKLYETVQPNAKLKNKSLILIAIMSVISVSMWLILFVTVVLYRVFFEFQIYFLTVAVVATVYAITTTLVLKALRYELIG